MGFDFLDFGFPKSGTDWKSINGKPYIIVSANGRSNGLSTKINDGSDFGPDTTLNATSPSQTGPPYTQTSGLQEALNYASQLYQQNINKSMQYTDIFIKGWLNVYTDIIAPTNINHIRIFGSGRGTSAINFMGGSRGFVLDNTNVYYFDHLLIISVNTTTPPSYLISYSVSSPNPNQALWLCDCAFYQNPSLNKTVAFNIQNANQIFARSVDFDLSLGTIYMSGTTPNNGSYLGFIGTIGNNQAAYIDGFDSVNLTDVQGLELNLGSNNNVNIKGGYYANQIQFQRSLNGTNYQANLGIVSINDIEISNSYNARNNPILIGTNGSVIQSTVKILDINGVSYIDELGITASTGTVYPVGFSNYPPNVGVYGSLITNKVRYKNILALNGLPIFDFEQLPPSLSANPPISGSVYQNSNPFNIRLKIPITYNPTTTTTATLATGISPSSTVTTSTKVSIPAGLTAADGQILTYEMIVPAGWYYELIATNATIGTVEVQPA